MLVVDLDGTVLASDLLFETFWQALSLAPIRSLRLLAGSGGRAGLKRRLAEASDLDVTLLPYDAEVIAEIEAWRADGGKTALVTASDAELAARIAAHLGIFDEVHGSDGVRNLKGRAKAGFVTERYGVGGYTYMGDAEADLPVWREAAGIITVNAGAGLRARAGALGPETRHLTTRPGGYGAWLRALRPHQWLKNLLIFVPILASHVFIPLVFVESLFAFVAFSLAASSVYVLNDLLDLSADRAHPRKRFRPLAAGAIPIGKASLLVPVIFAIAFVIALGIGPEFTIALLIYFALTLGYSLHLKQRTIIDIWVLAVLYTIRILAGAAATGIVPSVWLMAFSIFFFFSLAAVKRQAELVDLAARDEDETRRRGYQRDDQLLIAMMAIASGYVAVLVMALYIRTPFVASLYSSPPVLMGICLILLYWISRVVMMTHRGMMHDDPIIFALRDRVSLACLAGMALLAIIATVV